MKRVVAYGAGLMALWLAMTCAFAQPAEPETFAEVAQLCEAGLLEAQQQLEEDDAAATMEAMEAAWAPCERARQIGEKDLCDLEGAEHQEVVAMLLAWDLTWSRLFAGVGFCEEARSLLLLVVQDNDTLPPQVDELLDQASDAVVSCGELVPPYLTTNLSPIVGTVSIDSPQSIRIEIGVAGGSEDAQERFGDPCVGHVTEAPTFEMVVSQPAWIWVEAAATIGDLTLTVVGPSGVHCNDDFEGDDGSEDDPAIYQWFVAGTYQVWIGEVSRSDTGTPFTARFHIDELAVPEPEPIFGRFNLSSTSEPISVAGFASGEVSAEEVFNQDCAGYVTQAPSYLFNITETLSFTVEAHSSAGDLVLILTGASGTFCNDDFGDELDPVISETVTEGIYELYVGEYDDTDVGTWFEALVYVDPIERPRSLDDDETTPSHGTVQVGPGLPEVNVIAMSGGPVDATAVYGRNCRGFLPNVPSFLMEVTQTSRVHVSCMSDADTTLVVTGYGFTICNDDTDGLNPAIEWELPSGAYRVYVGSYQPYETDRALVHFSLAGN